MAIERAPGTPLDLFAVEDARRLYGVDNWGAGYFDFSNAGNLIVRPGKGEPHTIDVKEVIDELVAKKVSLPVLLRFPQLLSSQVRELCDSFNRAIAEFNYRKPYLPVFPIKVNQKREVVEELLRAGRRYNLGLEAGSKSELLVALAQEQSPDSLIVCNGFKDANYIQLAAMGPKIGKNVIVVIEKLHELEEFVAISKKLQARPRIGFRVKLYSKGSGRWEKSGGYTSKFGLTTAELIHAVGMLRHSNLLDTLRMLHFHIGSQITEIRKIKNAIKEASRVYAKIRKMNVEIEYLNCGGGLGIDYDGSKTSSDASVNYTIEEFANDVVYTIKDVCENESVPEPTIVSESGRALTAYHSMLVTNVIADVGGSAPLDLAFTGNEPQVVQELQYIRTSINAKNHREYYHDALEKRDELFTLFNLGYLSLDDRAKGEMLFWEIAKKAVKYGRTQKYTTDEFEDLEKQLSEKYILNFSVFQSTPDHWALDQLFPIIPIHRLNERPTRQATLCDITCDSDGEIDRFVDLKDVKEALEVHPLEAKKPYYIAILLVGAYQDVMGDFHNLFGSVNEAHVHVEADGRRFIRQVVKGNSVAEVQRYFGYEPESLATQLSVMAEREAKAGKISDKDAAKIVADYKSELTKYPYLHLNGG
jgi:arginine decarboxylase